MLKVAAVLWLCRYLYLLLRKPGNDHRLVTAFDLISAQRPTSYYHLCQRILRHSSSAIQLCRKDSLTFTHSTFFCGEAMIEVRFASAKACLRNCCQRVGVVRPHTYPTQPVQCWSKSLVKVKTSKSYLFYDTSYLLRQVHTGLLESLSSYRKRVTQLGCHTCTDDEAVLCFHTKREADRKFSIAKCLLLTAVRIVSLAHHVIICVAYNMGSLWLRGRRCERHGAQSKLSSHALSDHAKEEPES